MGHGRINHHISETVIAVALASRPQRAGFPLNHEPRSSKLPMRSWVKISIPTDRNSGARRSAQTGFSEMKKSTKSPWRRAFSKHLGNPSFAGTGWERLYAALSMASTTTARGAVPFWVGVELTHPNGPGYAGVFCADIAGEVLCTSELQRRTSALEAMRTQWPGGQLRFLTDVDDLRSAARRSGVFGAVVDAASPAALSLAESLANEITVGNARTALRVLSVISPPSDLRGTSPAGPLAPTPAPFDVLLRSKTTEPWLEHRDLAVMCAVQKIGLMGIDFSHVLRLFKEFDHAGGRWVSKRPQLAGAKALGVAHGPARAERAAEQAIREIGASVSLSQISGGIVDIEGDAKLKEIKTVMEVIRAACADETQFVLGYAAGGQGPFLKINLIAVTGGPDAAAQYESTLLH